MANIFVSHSSRDNAIATEIMGWLAQQGFDRVFLDIDKHAGIPPGAQWERTLYQQIDSAQAVILILTPNWLDSKWCFAEFTQARALGKAIFPIIVPPGGERLVSPDIQHLDLRADREGGLARLGGELTQLALNAQGGFNWDRTRPPYRGLLYFEAEDAAIFFGRDEESRRLIERLNARRVQGGAKMVALLGSSGSGKSSLMRAGVLPRLARDRRNWFVLPPFRPGADPLAQFARVVAEALDEPDDWRNWRDRLASDECARELEALADFYRTNPGARAANILISIDQGEELFTVTPPAEAKCFWKLLKAAADERSAFLVLMGLRADYLDLFQQSAEGRVRYEEFSLGPMPPARWRQIIEGPARIAGIRVEEVLISAAISDASTDDALPLLAFTLRELYDRYSEEGNRDPQGAKRQLLLVHYAALGDPAANLNPLENAVRKRADELIKDANPTAEELKALRDCFVGNLVRVNSEGDYIRRPTHWDAVPAGAYPLLEKLAQARLLVIDEKQGQKTVEVAHEALVRKWPRLRAWLDEERDFLVGKMQLEHALTDWRNAEASEKTDALLQGLFLSRARQWLDAHPQALTKDERDYIKVSHQHAAARERRRVQARFATAAVAIVAMLVIGFLVFQEQSAKREAVARQRGVDATVAAWTSGNFLQSSNYKEALDAAVKAERTLSTPETRSALLQSVLALSPHLARSLSVANPSFLIWLPGSEAVLVGDLNARILSWKPSAQEAVRDVAEIAPRDPASRVPPALRSLAVARQRGGLAVVGDGRLIGFEAVGANQPQSAHILAADINKASIGESGAHVIAASESTGEVHAFTCPPPTGAALGSGCVKTLLASDYATATALHETTGIAAVALKQNGLTLFNLAQPSLERHRIELSDSPNIRSLAFDRTGHWLAVGTAAGAIFVIDAQGQGQKISLPAQRSSIAAVAWDPTSSRLATACDGFAICIWTMPQTAGGEARMETQTRLVGHTGDVLAVAWAPSGQAIASAALDGTVKVWRTEPVDRVWLALATPDGEGLTDLDISADRKWLAASNIKGAVHIWDLQSLALVKTLPALRASEIKALRWHPTNPWLVQSDKEGWLTVRSFPDGDSVDERQIDTNVVETARWLPGGTSVAAGLFDGRLAAWSPRTRDKESYFKPDHPEAVVGLAVEPRTSRLLSSDARGNLWVWNLATREKLFTLPSSQEVTGKEASRDSVAVSQSGRAVIAAGNSGKLILYNLDERRGSASRDFGTTQIDSAEFGPADERVALVDRDAKLHLWSVKDDQLFVSVHVYPEGGAENYARGQRDGHLRKLVWVPELSSIAIASSGGEIRLISYDVEAWLRRAQSVFVSW